MTLTKAINLRLKKVWKKQKVVEKQKTKIVAAKYQRDRREISLFSQKNKDDSDKSNINLNQKDDFNLAFL